jgi:site-specific recombinase XerD
MTNQEVIEKFKRYLVLYEKREGTIETYSDRLNELFTFSKKNFDEIIMPDLQVFLQHKSKTCINSSLKQYISAFNTFFSYCEEQKYCIDDLHLKNVSDKGRRKRLDKRPTLAPDQYNEFVWKLEEYFRSHEGFLVCRTWVMLYLLLYGMMRKCIEAANVKETDISILPSGKYKIHVIGKGGHEGEVILPESFKEPYELYLKYKKKFIEKKKFTEVCEYLLITTHNKQIYETAFNNDVNWMTQFVGFDFHLSPHRLRQAGGNKMKEEGCPAETVRKAMRHKLLSTTMGEYFKSYENIADQEDAVDCMMR